MKTLNSEEGVLTITKCPPTGLPPTRTRPFWSSFPQDGSSYRILVIWK